MRNCRLFHIIITVLSLLGMFSCRSKVEYITISGFAQGGGYNIILALDSGYVRTETCGSAISEGQTLKHSIDSLLSVIDNSISGYNPTSLLSRANAGEDVIPDEVFTTCLTVAERYRELSSGAVDCFKGAVFDLWGFGFTADSLPSKAQLQEALAKRKYNFNAIAQGVSSDLVARLLEDRGISSYLINIGGEIACNGVNPAGAAWRVGIDNPVVGNITPGEDLRGVLICPPGKWGIVTSGDYRKYYERDGVRYSHTIDPRSGRPAGSNLLSATIVAPTSADADAIATWCMVVGFDAAQGLIESLPNVQGYLISGAEIWHSPSLVVE